MTQINKNHNKTTIPHEDILVVERTTLLGDQVWTGCKPINVDSYLSIIQEHKQFLPRVIMEEDPRYKQIIPYLIFTYNNRYFLMQRKSEASEQRLKNKLTLGIGGHIRKEDVQASTNTNTNPLFSWALREFHEEVAYNGTLSIEPLCLINDDSNDVGKVHLGFALLLKADSGDIRIKSELKHGSLATVEECFAQKDAMETWSQMVLTFMHQR